MGWLIDPADRSILIFPLGQQPQMLQAPQEILPVPSFAVGLHLTLGDVFGWLKL